MIRIKPFVVVAAVDGSDLTASVLQRALDAAAHRPDHEVHVVRVIEEGPGSRFERAGEVEALLRQLDNDVADVLDTIDGRPRDGTCWRIWTHVLAGIPTEEVASLAADVEAQLIVLGRRNQAARGDSAISAERLLRLARCPVLIVQPIDYDVAAPADEPRIVEERTWHGAA